LPAPLGGAESPKQSITRRDRNGARTIPCKSPLLTAVPQTLEKRQEIINAIRTFTASDDGRLKRRTEITALRSDLERLRQDVLELWRQCEPRARSYVIKYSSDQPRVPSGNPDGGQWTNEGGSTSPGGPPSDPQSEDASRSVQYAVLNTGTRTDATKNESEIQVAAGTGHSGYPIDLQEEEARGGHTIGAHVGQSESSLLAEIRQIALSAGQGVGLVNGLREGSFPTLEAANKLVNSTVAQNQDKVALVAAGLLPRAELDAQFDSPTGYEAFLRTGNSTPYIRPTYGVRVIIVPDPGSAEGYRVDTAFPRNFDR